jgi:hypothetical protein
VDDWALSASATATRGMPRQSARAQDRRQVVGDGDW